MSDELMLDSMGATPTGFEIKTSAGGPQTAETLLFIADSIRSVLDGYDAPNYVEMEVKGTDDKRYIMTLQRAGKVTPHGARQAAEAAIARVMTLADLWEREGERDMAASKTVPDEDAAMALLTEGAAMVENARLVRNAARGQA